jgi:hypothetical protein
MRILLIATLFFIAENIRAKPLWLVIAASSPSPAEIAREAQVLRKNFPTGLIVQSADWGAKTNIFAFVVEICEAANTADKALVRAREIRKDSHIRKCTPRPGSLLDFRVAVVDNTIAEVPSTSVNWTDADRVSSGYPLEKESLLVIARSYNPAPEDPAEGKRQRLILLRAGQAQRTLVEQCLFAGAPAVRGGHFAISCATEQAADHFLHDILIFNEAGETLKKLNRARNPEWVNQNEIRFDGESVNSEGNLELKKTVFRLDR